jgi:hypothetical protein
MKTTKRSNQTFPSPIRFSIYLFAVAVLCFVNWTALRADDPVEDMTSTLEERLFDALIEEADSDPELENWMLNFADDYLVANKEQDIVLEDWMLNFADDYHSANTEHDIALEDWMIDCDIFCSIDSEKEQILKEWMVNTDEWSRNELLAKK